MRTLIDELATIVSLSLFMALIAVVTGLITHGI